jgi:hypothetical protein
MGIWVHIPDAAALGDGVIDINGTEPGTTVIQLYTGWNLIGYPSQTPRVASDTLPSEADMISVFDAGEPYLVRDVTDLGSETLECYNGYWVHVTSDTVWTVEP